MQFTELITTLENCHARLSQQAIRQADQLMLLRNYLFGFYIVEFEQSGQDRAAYGTQLLQRLSDELHQRGLKGMSDRSLRQFRQFYLTYPEIWQSLTAKSHLVDLQKLIHLNPPTVKVNPAIPPLDISLLLERLTFTHFAELLRVEDPLKRRFYEIEALKNNWTIRDLR